MKNFSEERVGEFSALSSGILNSLFPVIAILSFISVGPITSLAWTTLFSLIFFIIVAALRHTWVNIFDKEIFLPMIGATVIVGIVFYALFYFGLKYTSAGNASIIATLEIFFSFLFFNVWRKEFIDRKHLAGAGLMLFCAIIILSPNFTSFHVGDFLILLAVFIVPFGNLFQKQLRSKISSDQILLFRTLVATPVLFLLAYFSGESLLLPMNGTLLVILVNGLILFGLSKILWVEGIYRIGVTKSISLASVSPVFTLIFAFLLLKNVPTLAQIIAVPVAMLGIYFLTRHSEQGKTQEI